MKIAVMGAGALGGYFGGRLQAAGHDVAFIARGAHLRALQTAGLRIRSPKGNLHLEKVTASASPKDIGPADIILFMVKNYDLDHSAEAIDPMMGPQTMVVTCQNGVSAPERLGAIIGADHVVPGVARIPADIPEPGVINHSATMDHFSFGEPSGARSARVMKLHDALEDAGLSVTHPESILHDLWHKFISQSSLAGLTTLTQQDIGPLRNNAESKALFIAAMREAERVARAEIPDLPEGIVDDIWARLDNLPDTMHASMLDDLRAGKRLEVDYLSGDVVRYGKKHGIATPIHHVFWAALQPVKAGAVSHPR